VVLALVGVVVVMVVVVVDFGPLPLELQAPVSAVKAMAAAIPATTGKRWGMRFSVIEFRPSFCVSGPLLANDVLDVKYPLTAHPNQGHNIRSGKHPDFHWRHRQEIGPPPKLVGHLEGDKRNNFASNLQWARNDRRSIASTARHVDLLLLGDHLCCGRGDVHDIRICAEGT
jgi:hypothetical protein